MRKAFAAAFAALVGMSVSAQAADVYEGSLKDEPVYATAPIWTGLYVGGHIGGLWNKKGESSLSKSWNYKELHCNQPLRNCTWQFSDWSKPEKVDDAEFESDETERSLLGGVHIGYNWQNGTRVYGVEGDVSFAKGLDYLGSLRARLGHAVDNTLFYATAGIAFAGFENKTIGVDAGWYEDSFDVDGERSLGAVVGGGIEHKIASNISIGLEGLYYLFKDSDFGGEAERCYASWKSHCLGYKKYEFTHEDDNDLFVVRARLNYHLQEAYEQPLK